MEIFIYKLIDPISNEIRYIGKTGNLKNRFAHHISHSKKLKSHISNWITSLVKQNKLPIIEVIETCNEDNWEEREIYWISFYKSKKLCNVHSGGKLRCIDSGPRKLVKKYDLHENRFRVRCSYLNTVYQIGKYDSEKEAIIAYDTFYKDPYNWIITNPRLPNNQNHNKRVYVYTKELEFINSFDSVVKCASWFNIDASSIAQCCNKRLKTYKKMIFKYELIKEESK